MFMSTKDICEWFKQHNDLINYNIRTLGFNDF